MRTSFYLSAALIVLSACEQPAANENQPEFFEHSQEELKSNDEVASAQDDDDAVDERLSFAGFESRIEAEQFISTIKDLIARDDRDGFTNLIRLPFTVYKNGSAVAKYSTKEALLADFDLLVTPAVREGIAESSYEALILNWRGGAICGGCIWFNKFDGRMKIFRISG